MVTKILFGASFCLLAALCFILGPINFLLGALFWSGAVVLAALSAAALALALCAVIGVFNVFRHKGTWALVLGYAFGSLICLLLIQGGLLLADAMSDHTGHWMQRMIFVGLAYLGLLALGIIVPYVGIALRKTRVPME